MQCIEMTRRCEMGNFIFGVITGMAICLLLGLLAAAGRSEPWRPKRKTSREHRALDRRDKWLEIKMARKLNFNSVPAAAAEERGETNGN
jgi:gas vesicle protein